MSESKCPKCDALVNWDMERCPRCRFDVGPPNVRLVAVAAEKTALQQRYQAMLDDLRGRGVEPVAVQFEKAVRENSRAAVDVWPDFLWQLLNDRRTLYAGYQLLVDHGVRRAATFRQDSHRRAVDDMYTQVAERWLRPNLD